MAVEISLPMCLQHKTVVFHYVNEISFWVESAPGLMVFYLPGAWQLRVPSITESGSFPSENNRHSYNILHGSPGSIISWLVKLLAVLFGCTRISWICNNMFKLPAKRNRLRDCSGWLGPSKKGFGDFFTCGHETKRAWAWCELLRSFCLKD